MSNVINREKERGLDPEILRELFTYEKETGLLIWRKRDARWFKNNSRVKNWNTRYAGKRAGSVCKKHLAVDIFGITHFVHRVIWALVYGRWPTGEIDHIDGDGFNNRIDNLRDVTTSQNRKNACAPRTNTSGVVGVYRNTRNQKWCAQIKSNGITRHLGSFETLKEAAAARKAAEEKAGFHQNHGRIANG